MPDDSEVQIALESVEMDKDKVIEHLCTVSRLAASLCAVLESYIGEEKVVELINDFRNEKLIDGLCKGECAERIGDRIAMYAQNGERVLVKEFLPMNGEAR